VVTAVVSECSKPNRRVVCICAIQFLRAERPEGCVSVGVTHAGCIQLIETDGHHAECLECLVLNLCKDLIMIIKLMNIIL